MDKKMSMKGMSPVCVMAIAAALLVIAIALFAAQPARAADGTITIDVNAASKVYGERDPELTAEVTGADPEDIIFVVERAEGEDAGTYTITAEIYYVPDGSEVIVNDASMTIVPRDVNVDIIGHNYQARYDGSTHSVSGYDAIPDDQMYDISSIVCSGKAAASRSSDGTTMMGLKASMFSNTDKNFNVAFIVTDGYVTVGPADGAVPKPDKQDNDKENSNAGNSGTNGGADNAAQAGSNEAGTMTAGAGEQQQDNSASAIADGDGADTENAEAGAQTIDDDAAPLANGENRSMPMMPLIIVICLAAFLLILFGLRRRRDQDRN